VHHALGLHVLDIPETKGTLRSPHSRPATPLHTPMHSSVVSCKLQSKYLRFETVNAVCLSSDQKAWSCSYDLWLQHLGSLRKRLKYLKAYMHALAKRGCSCIRTIWVLGRFYTSLGLPGGSPQST